MTHYCGILKTEDKDVFKVVFRPTRRFNKKGLVVEDIIECENSKEYLKIVEDFLGDGATPTIRGSSLEYQVEASRILSLAYLLHLQPTFDARYQEIQKY